MGKAALFAIAAFALAGAYYTLSSQRGSIETNKRLSGHQFEVLARNAAITGYMQARQIASDEGGFIGHQSSGTFEGANYTVAITPLSTMQGIITATGWVEGSERRHEINIRAEVERLLELDEVEDIPVFMRYGMASNGDLNVSGTVVVDTLRVEGNEENLINANLHSNGKLSTRGNSASIRGFGTYGTTHDVGHDKVFQPYHNPTNEPVLQKVPPIDIPKGFNATELAMALGPDRIEGSFTLPATLDVSGGDNSADNPYVFLVNGDLTAPPGINIIGHVIFLTQGNIDLQGGVGIGGATRTTTSVGFYASDDVTVGGNAGIWGTLVAGNNIKFNGNPTIYGGIGIGNIAEIVGTPTIKYIPPSRGLAKPFVEADITLNLVSYNEW